MVLQGRPPPEEPRRSPPRSVCRFAEVIDVGRWQVPYGMVERERPPRFKGGSLRINTGYR